MEILVDARQKACPHPVIMTKKALDSIEKGRVITMVDNDIARDNVAKLAKNQNMDYTVREKSGTYEITIDKGSPGVEVTVPVAVEEAFSLGTNYNLFIGRDTLGSGDEKLGKLLLKSYLYALLEAASLPKSILFVNSGVFVTTKESEVIDILKELEVRGVEIISCGTCLDFYGLKEELRVGKITNMYEIVEKTINIRTFSL